MPYEVLEPESATHFLRHYDSDRPLCLIVSLVNPHDVLGFPGTGSAEVDGKPRFIAAGYENAEFADLPYEMYDLATPRDEREVVNLGNPATDVSPEIAAERERLHQRLIQVMDTLGTRPESVVWPEHWGEQRPGESERPARGVAVRGEVEPPVPVAPIV